MKTGFYLKISNVSVALALVVLGSACNSLTECQRYFPVPSEALSCQRGADDVAAVVKGRFAALPDDEKAEKECRALCADDLGGFSGGAEGEFASELIDLQVACVKGCIGRIYYDRTIQDASGGCEQVRGPGGIIRCE
jgi:hypothetical protein